MKKELKAVCGMVLAAAAVLCAGRAGAQTSINMEPAGYIMKPAAWGQVSRPSSSDRLSEAAESLAEAAKSGDNAKTEALLANLYSGAAGKEAAAPVYAGNRQTASAPVAAAPAPAAPAQMKLAPDRASAVEELEESADESVSEDEDADVKADDAEDEAPAEVAADDVGDAAAEEKPKQSFWDTLLGGGLGMLLVILLLLL
ncbi:MAG: hypothetical protein PHV36_08745 [Elusimicrobiales bacterium]|nr:hypothetical protein [Elusimicrobiales bacterium]